MFLDPSALLCTKFAFWFPPFSTQICTENLCPPARNPRPPARKIRGTCAEDPHCSAQLSTGVRAEQPWNSSEKVKVSVSCTVCYCLLHILTYCATYILHECGSAVDSWLYFSVLSLLCVMDLLNTRW